MVGRKCELHARDGHAIWGTLSAAVRSAWGQVSVVPSGAGHVSPMIPLKVSKVMARAAGIAPTPMAITTAMHVAYTRVRCRGVA